MTGEDGQLPQLIDPAGLSAFLEEHLGPGDLEVERHRAGHSNETFFVTYGGKDMVLRRPPLGAFLPSAHDVGREFRVLSALNGAPARTPSTILSSDDDSVIGAPFYLMERVAGVVIRDSVPETYGSDDRRRIGFELVESLAELHAVDIDEHGLRGLAKSEGYLERQLKRWTGQLELTLPHTRPLPDLEATGEWLRSRVPETQTTTLVHGDYKLDNVVFSAEPPARLVAILDWEMSTLGDPLADLGWMISFWREAGDPVDDVFARTSRVTEEEGFASRSDLVDRYSELTGLDVADLDWYRVLAIWKLAILLEGSYARHLAGMTDDPFFEEMEEGVPSLARRALEIAGA